MDGAIIIKRFGRNPGAERALLALGDGAVSSIKSLTMTQSMPHLTSISCLIPAPTLLSHISP